MRLTTPAVLIGALGVAACVPIRTPLTPAVSGAVYFRGAAIQGADVYVLPQTLSAQCRPSQSHSVTAADGAFQVPAVSKFVWRLPIGDRLIAWTVCINYKDRWSAGYSESDFYLRHESIRLKCDLAAEAHGNARGICEVDDV
jgi:hypothetical protein